MSEIRIRNDTGADLDDVLVTPLDGSRRRTPLGPLGRGATSGWLQVAVAHRYPAVEASGAAGDLVHLPYEAGGQPPLPTGRYTYVLRLDGGRLVIDLEPGDEPDGTGTDTDTARGTDTDRC